MMKNLLRSLSFFNVFVTQTRDTCVIQPGKRGILLLLFSVKHQNKHVERIFHLARGKIFMRRGKFFSSQQSFDGVRGEKCSMRKIEFDLKEKENGEVKTCWRLWKIDNSNCFLKMKWNLRKRKVKTSKK